MNKAEQFDVIVMGGGPGGSSTATFLAQKGHKVLLLEKERFPRFHIGESLLPALWEIWEKMGIASEMESQGYLVKQGVNFAMFNSPNFITNIPLLTAEYPQYFSRSYAFHVERARYDQFLLNFARRNGVDAREEWTVHDVLFDGNRAVGVSAGPNGGAAQTFRAPIVVDATGRSTLIARKLGWHKRDPKLSKVAYFSHFKGAHSRYTKEVKDALSDQSLVEDNTYMTDIHTIDAGWIWYIPIHEDIVSIGAVVDIKHDFGTQDPQIRFERAIASCHRISEWMKSSTQVLDMQVISNISYVNDCFVGDGFVLVGDAAMFVDPIFSAGVTLAMRGGMFAAETIHEAFQAGDFSAARLAPYEAKIRRPMSRIFKLIYNWYEILQAKDPGNLFSMAQKMPILRERLIILLSGGYDRVDMEKFFKLAENTAAGGDQGKRT